MPDPSFAFAATREKFPQLMLENSYKAPVQVDLWAARAGPSRRQRGLLLRLANAYGGRFGLAPVHLPKDGCDGALAGLAELVKRDPEYPEGISRRALGVVLDLLDAADERVRRYGRPLFGY
jgi:thioredoxin-like negative regulator of GroEL